MIYEKFDHQNTTRMQNEIFPVFPLKLIILPGEIVPLHIYEPRYKQLINDIILDQKSFVIPFVKDNKIQNTGSLVRLYKVLTVSSSGEMDVLIQGQEIVKVTSLVEQIEKKLYSGGLVHFNELFVGTASLKLQALFFQYKDEIHRINKEKQITNISSDRLLDIAGQLPLTIDEKEHLILLENQEKIEGFLIEKINTYHIINERVEEIGYKFYLN